ncbi:hypothetical protein [Roseivirga sp.]|uniref:hypothetical protein n=1 Tax=Roseivirga sp. TaxID=1964215 RepID=UPI002B273B11|nr:hypothetical protein [Roseivirga sp.]
MKVEAGKYIVQLRRHGLESIHHFLKIWKTKQGWWFQTDHSAKQLIDKDDHNAFLEDIHVEFNLSNSYHPKFEKIEIIVKATSDKGTSHIFTSRSGEQFEKIFKCFPGLVDRFWADKYRKEKIFKYLSKGHHKPE